MKNILIMIHNLEGGGAEKVLKDLLDNIDNSKYKIDILLLERQGVYLKDIEEKYNVKSILKNRIKINNIILRKINSLIRRLIISLKTNRFILNTIVPNKYDIEITFLEGRCAKIISNRKNNAKKIAWVHTDLEKHRSLSIKEEKKVYGRFDKIVAVSNDSKKSIIKLYPMYESKIEVIYNPIDVKKIRSMAKLDKVEYKKDNINLVTVGRLSYEKGYDILLQVHKELINEGYNHKLNILGEGSQEYKLRDFIKKHNLEETVKLLGFKSNPYPYIYNADGFITSSRYEGLSLVTAEALVLGKPIVSTKCAGPTEMLDNGKYGILVECESTESLKSGIKEIISSKDSREYYSNLALERSRIFDITKTMKDIELLLDTV